jgi:hypothetical protein
MATKKTAGSPFLAFLGSLVYLYVTFTIVAGGAAGLWVSGAGSLWLPVLGGLAALSAIVLFILTLTTLMGTATDLVRNMTKKFTMVGGFTLLALTGPSGALGANLGGPFLWTALGFVLLFLGTEWGHWM